MSNSALRSPNLRSVGVLTSVLALVVCGGLAATVKISHSPRLAATPLPHPISTPLDPEGGFVRQSADPVYPADPPTPASVMLPPDSGVVYGIRVRFTPDMCRPPTFKTVAEASNYMVDHSPEQFAVMAFLRKHYCPPPGQVAAAPQATPVAVPVAARSRRINVAQNH